MCVCVRVCVSRDVRRRAYDTEDRLNSLNIYVNAHDVLICRNTFPSI